MLIAIPVGSDSHFITVSVSPTFLTVTAQLLSHRHEGAISRFLNETKNASSRCVLMRGLWKGLRLSFSEKECVTSEIFSEKILLSSGSFSANCKRRVTNPRSFLREEK